MFALPFFSKKNVSHFFIVFLALFSAGLVVHQSTTITPMIDYSYQVENAYRIFRGEIPYRDFFLVLPPGTYMLMAFVMKLTGGYQHIGQVILTALTQFFIVILTYKIIRHYHREPWGAIVLTLPVLTANHVLFPWPNYDVFAVLFILISMFFILTSWNTNRYRPGIFFFNGIVATLPSYFKQNTGLVFVILLVTVLFISSISYKTKQRIIEAVLFLFGSIFSYLYFLGWLMIHKAINPAIYQLYEFPKSVRDVNEAIRIVISQYVDVVNTLQIALPIFFVVFVLLVIRYIAQRHQTISYVTLLNHLITSVLFFGSIIFFAVVAYKGSNSATYTYTVQYSFVLLYGLYILLTVITIIHNIHKRSVVPLTLLFPIPLIGAANATYLSHHVVGSSFGLWPFFAIIVAVILSILKKHISLNWMIISVPFICFVSFQLFSYAMRNEIHMYIPHNGPAIYSQTERLYGLATPGSTLPQMDRMFSYVKTNIPENDIVAFTPGDDPFFAVTGRKNPMHFTQLHMQTYKLDFPTLVPELKKRNVTWVVIKTKYQTPQYYGLIDVANDYFHLSDDYNLIEDLDGFYRIYKRKSS